MRTPLLVAFHGIDHSESVEQCVRAQVARLDKMGGRITACRVAIEAHHAEAASRRRNLKIRIGVRVPGTELLVTHDPRNGVRADHLRAGIVRAFSRMERLLKEHRARLHG